MKKKHKNDLNLVKFSPVNKVKKLIELCKKNSALSFDKRVEYGKEAIILAHKIKNDKLKINAHKILCQIYFDNYKYEDALASYQIMLDYYKKSK